MSFQNIIYRIFTSPALALLLLLVFAIAMGAATFIENDFGTATAWIQVYDSWWFEMVMLGLGLCFVANIYKYRLWRREKWPILLFHIAFIVILLGAAVTRYYSYGGIMRIREGAASRTIISDKNYLQVHISDGTNTKHLREELYFSPVKNNEFQIDSEFEALPISISLNQFVADA